MNNEQPNLVCFSSISISNPIIFDKEAQSDITLTKVDGSTSNFTLKLKYENKLNNTHLPLLRMAFCMPLLNYGLFSKKINLDFPTTESDINLINKMNLIFSRDIFVNKIIRRRTNYILPEFFPNENMITPEDANPKAQVEPIKITSDNILTQEMDNNRCGILSSSGKESLLTYGLLEEIGSDVYPLYINESGGHWRTALPGYQYHKDNEPNTQRIWTNVDRFYNFMLDNLKFIRPDYRKIRGDTYPIRLCIFPYYIFALLPIFIDKKIGNLLIGSEFDDLRISPKYCGITHYYGIYDQHQDYDDIMNAWYSKRIPRLVQWSALRNISGLIVERILIKRYPKLAKNQRSCHSCHIEKKEIIPCGTCSKCMGVLLFLLANNADPKIMNFREIDISSFPKRVEKSNLRLDQDEKDQSFFLLGKNKVFPAIKPVDHVEKIHINNSTCNPAFIPKQFRDKLIKIIKLYTTGFCELKDDKWIPLDEINYTI